MKAGWEVRPLGEVSDFIGGGTPSKKEAAFWGGDIPWVSPKDMKSEVVADSIDKVTEAAIAGSAAKWIPKGSILVVVRSGILARTIPVAISGRALTVNQDLKAIVPSAAVEPRYLAYRLQSAEEYLLNRVTRGATVHKLDMPVLKSLPIPLPPLEEQKRIVAVLDAAFEGLTRARTHIETNLQNARELFASGVEAIFERIPDAELQKLRLGSIVSRLTNGYVGPTRNIYVDEGVPYLLARHVKNNTMTFDGKTFVTPEFNERHKKSKLKAGDVLLVQSGHIGHCAVVPEEHDGHNCHAMIVLSAIPEILSGNYLSAVLNTPALQDDFQRIRTGSTVPHLTCKLVKELTLPVPNREKQDETVREIQSLRARLDMIENTYASKLQDLDDLRQSLLQKAFAGELT